MERKPLLKFQNSALFMNICTMVIGWLQCNLHGHTTHLTMGQLHQGEIKSVRTEYSKTSGNVNMKRGVACDWFQRVSKSNGALWWLSTCHPFLNSTPIPKVKRSLFAICTWTSSPGTLTFLLRPKKPNKSKRVTEVEQATFGIKCKVSNV